MKDLTVLSLCDGMSCGQIALGRAGFRINKYYASEIKDIAIKVAKENYPETIHIGDVRGVKYHNGVLYTENGYTERKKGHCLMVSGSRPNTTPVKAFHRYYGKGFDNLVFKNKEHYEKCKKYYDEHYKGMSGKEIPTGETNVFEGIRYLNQKELGRCQTVPEGYTKCLNRNEAANVLGDGWTVDVIAHIFSFMK